MKFALTVIATYVVLVLATLTGLALGLALG